MAELSGSNWINKFPNSTNLDDLVDPFRTNAKNFVAALPSAGATVSVSATLRPPERAFLMHYAYKIAKAGLDPSSVPTKAKVDINWLWLDKKGKADVPASRKAASEMVSGYGIVYAPALITRHSEGKAIDMNISWCGDLTIGQSDKALVVVKSNPKTGLNSDLQAVGATYNVIKLATDPPHWSSDGH